MDHLPTSVIFVVVFAVLGLVISAISLPTDPDRQSLSFMMNSNNNTCGWVACHHASSCAVHVVFRVGHGARSPQAADKHTGQILLP